ncbi:DUF4268 domain-containing protein [Nocardioides sp. Y6]|uniref:DUF4268 domain-containing protein n=1 Tax=Nocardioides malaquae TaxID=2773426 RepID=A0ABR9RSZ0_9ACTN|nr:DUF4268 domain-containing protein [Nocardioides malaquae]MBE7324500.1 DUF4268 domain-containing protein [Nocardioides malaquae]
MTIELGRLATVTPQEVWPHEAHDFTPWLLANVDVLSDLLGMDLELTAAEHPVGNFRLDLIGHDTTTGERVIVENQLATSDHTHLGQIITYAAGTDPTTIVWITTGFRPEHRAAIDWLNERTDENTRVFGVVIHVVRIGESPVAPNFELVAQPNDWEKTVRQVAAGSAAVSEQAVFYTAFWEQFLLAARETRESWVPRGRTTRSGWMDTRTGVVDANVTMWFQKRGLSLQVYFGSNDEALNSRRYEALLSRRDQLDVLLGADVEWDPMPGRKASRLVIPSPFPAMPDEAQWPAVNAWLIDHQRRVRAALESVGFESLMEQAGENP